MTEISELKERYQEQLDQIERIMNTSGCSANKIGKAIPYVFHNTLEQNFMRMVVSFITEIATSERLYSDGRNEATHLLCKKIYNLLKENGEDLKYVSLPFI